MGDVLKFTMPVKWSMCVCACLVVIVVNNSSARYIFAIISAILYVKPVIYLQFVSESSVAACDNNIIDTSTV